MRSLVFAHQSFLRFTNIFLSFSLAIVVLFGCESTAISPSPPLTPTEALESFHLADENVKIELVAAEPLVQDPVAMTFDEGGRLWVVEMLGFMPDIDGTGEQDKVGRISVLFDDDNDGIMDRGQIFLDSLVLPRAIAVVDGGILVAESIPLWYVEDTDGDFRADKKTLVDAEYGGIGMPEHSANGLLRGLDNWYYNAKSKYRYRRIDGEWIKEETEFRGQWGICHDDAGRLYYNYNWSQLHADLVPPGALRQNKNHTSTSGIDHGLTLERKIFPIRSNTAINRGYVPGTLDDQDRLLEFASACGPLINRGWALPDSYYGDAFICEPTANLLKRNKVSEDGFMLSAKGVYENKEFLASTDERFRPVSLSSGPDGALYMVDMYRGIIQHGPYMTPYLREVTLKRGLDKPINMGRIWRITSKEKKKVNIPNLEDADSATLLKYLGDANGWTRDMAQRLLVEQKDLAIVPELKQIILKDEPFAPLHALWTLEGLEVKDPAAYLVGLGSKNAVVAQSTLRLLQMMAPERPEVKGEIEKFILANYDGAEPLLQMQMVLVSDLIDDKVAFENAQKFLGAYGDLPVGRDVVMSSLQNSELAMLKNLFGRLEWKKQDQNKEIFIEQLVTAITNKGATKELDYVLNLLENENNTALWVKTAVANGVRNSRSDKDSQIALASIPQIFKNLDKSDVSLQAIVTEIQDRFIWPGKPVQEEVKTESEQTIDRELFAEGRQKYLNLCASCHGTGGEGMPRFAPPLKQSEWVTGDGQKLAMIILHGMEGPVRVNGRIYDIPDILPNMPSFSTLQDQDISAITSYIRNTWGHSEPPILRRTIGGIRFRTQGKVTPWKSSELDTLVFDINM